MGQTSPGYYVNHHTICFIVGGKTILSFLNLVMIHFKGLPYVSNFSKLLAKNRGICWIFIEESSFIRVVYIVFT